MDLNATIDNKYKPATVAEHALFEAAKSYGHARAFRWNEWSQRRKTFRAVVDTISSISVPYNFHPTPEPEALLRAFQQGYLNGLGPEPMNHGFIQYRPDIQADDNFGRINRIEAAIRKLAAKTPREKLAAG